MITEISHPDNSDEVEHFIRESVDTHLGDRPPHSSPSFSESVSPTSEKLLSSPPSTPLPFDCRCGENGEGNYQSIRQDAIECMGCDRYSHVACLPHPYKDWDSEPDSSFICQKCTEGRFRRVKPTKERVGRVDLITNVGQRLRRGQSVLVQDGPYWRYVARLVYPETKSKWRIKWWSGNRVDKSASHNPGTYEIVSSSRIVDALYGDVKGRRSVRLGRWTTAPEEIANNDNARQARDEIVERPDKSLPYTEKIHHILSPHQTRLARLIFDRSKLNSADFPTLAFLRRYRLTAVPYTGGLSLETRSQIMNWMYNQIPGVHGTLPTWVTDGSLQEAFLLWIADRDRAEFEKLPGYPSTKSDQARFIRDQAWLRLKQSTSQGNMDPEHEGIDVDLESLAQLEADIFDMSEIAGCAGNCQWGLDVGIHQEDWWPYINYSTSDIDRDRDDEGETKPGRRFLQDPYTIQWKRAKANQQEADEKRKKLPRPEPRRVKKG
ncbi:hypothetical protein PQX77_004891 [Marasmius sp. AFHP31]|nr:hypothetical protein PQX77_004891 [Marasmius sp. AFHP31]